MFYCISLIMFIYMELPYFSLRLQTVASSIYRIPMVKSNIISAFHVRKTHFLHFELNYITGVNRLTPLANFPHTFKNEEKDIPHLVTKKFA